MFHIGPWELVLILIIAIIIFGPKRLPDIGRSIGQTMQELKKALEGKKGKGDTADQAPPPMGAEAVKKPPESPGEPPEGAE